MGRVYCAGPNNNDQSSVTVQTEVLRIPKATCPSVPCYYGIGVSGFGALDAAYTIVIANASQPVLLVRCCVRACLPVGHVARLL